MPLQSPSEPKQYTTSYSDFRGVDFTNDPTNVWKRRSPTGLNMMPDDSGRPWKRTGWDIDIPKEEFIDLYCYKKGLEAYDGYFFIEKVYNFSLHGNDYIILFTNLGVFSYTDYGINFLRDSGDSARSFFFESGAVAGFYIFDKDELYRFDGYVLIKISPYIPTVLISRTPTGGGELYEAVNLIGNKRTDSFIGDESSLVYYTSAPIQDKSSVVVQVMNSDGTFVTINAGYTVGDYCVTFATAQKPVKEGEDNVRITYSTQKISTVTETMETTVSVAVKPKKGSISLAAKTSAAASRKKKLKRDYLIFEGGQPLLELYTISKTSGNWAKANNSRFKITSSLGRATVEVLATQSDFPGKYTTKNNKKTWKIKIVSHHSIFTENQAAMAFSTCKACTVYGTGLINSVFMSGSSYRNYSSRVWYSKTGDPTYFPDTNYFEAGSTDTQIMGLVKVGEYLGIIKQGDTIDSTIYLAYPVSFEDNTAYAVKQSVNGVGAVSQRCFNVLNDETLFLSKEGVMAIEPSLNENERQVKNRSYYINAKLLSETDLNEAISFVWKGLYMLCVNSHCYILDGAQKSSWANEKTNLQYECYYWDNIPATCFTQYDGALWFADGNGNMCRLKDIVNDGNNAFNDNGIPIKCEWSTILDNDGATNYFKNLQKKGCLVTILPLENTGADVYAKADDKEPSFIGTISAENPTVPQEFYLNKKIKKYKRLQIIVKNENLNQGFGLQEIIKVYTIGNYSKNRGASNGT